MINHFICLVSRFMFIFLSACFNGFKCYEYRDLKKFYNVFLHLNKSWAFFSTQSIIKCTFKLKLFAYWCIFAKLNCVEEVINLLEFCFFIGAVYLDTWIHNYTPFCMQVRSSKRLRSSSHSSRIKLKFTVG